MNSVFSFRFATAAGVISAGILLFGWIALPPSDAGFQKSDSKVKVVAKAGSRTANGLIPITIQVDIDKGWYIYANPVGNETFAPNATVVEVYSGKKKVAAQVKYPKGKLKILGKESLNIYKDRATIRAYVPAASASLQVHVKVNACNKSQCLLPGTKKVSVK